MLNPETAMILLTILGAWFGFVSYRAGIRKGFENAITDSDGYQECINDLVHECIEHKTPSASIKLIKKFVHKKSNERWTIK